MLAVDPSLYPLIEGTTDSEALFFLALTLGLEEDPPGAVERAIGLVEEIGRKHGVQYPFQGTIATTNGERLWAFRYSSEGKSRSLYFSTTYDTLKALYPDDPRLAEFDEESSIIVSEPLGDVAGVWNPVPEASWGVVSRDGTSSVPSGRPCRPRSRPATRRSRSRRPRRRSMPAGPDPPCSCSSSGSAVRPKARAR